MFAEGEEEQVIRAAVSFVHQGLGRAMLVGREEQIKATAEASGLDISDNIEIHNAADGTLFESIASTDASHSFWGTL